MAYIQLQISYILPLEHLDHIETPYSERFDIQRYFSSRAFIFMEYWKITKTS